MPSPPSNPSTPAALTERALRSRRRLLAAIASSAAAASTAGCLGDAIGTDPSTPDSGPAETTTSTETTPPDTARETTREVTDSGTYADAPDGPESYPSRPSDPDRATAVEFVEAFEHARTYNSLHEDDVEDLSVSAKSQYDRAAHGGHYALATTTGYANYADGVHADWGQAPALYHVSADLVVRVGRYEDYYGDCEDVFASDDPSENFAEICEGGDAAFRAYNLHPDAHTVTVDVDYLDESGATDVLAEEYFVGTTDAVQQGSVTYRKGTYRITATLENGAHDSADWTLDREPTWDDPPLCVLVEPTGGLDIRRVPFQEL
ncbi:hypothetical protein G9C85_03100 [Halorubellus sp. JP-L1]|uniref:hypothetical protein n=1 Tax=Halorubellus sp. JP-L1 TaxID=2715753 RepID=UPI00140A2AC6|nr:hypothetical protein [Halorubellus sp. JP-L1]NHN40625.1 hypothetical protein [Halorubellus sp. JP-L1]